MIICTEPARDTRYFVRGCLVLLMSSFASLPRSTARVTVIRGKYSSYAHRASPLRRSTLGREGPSLRDYPSGDLSSEVAELVQDAEKHTSRLSLETICSDPRVPWMRWPTRPARGGGGQADSHTELESRRYLRSAGNSKMSEHASGFEGAPGRRPRRGAGRE